MKSEVSGSGTCLLGTFCLLVVAAFPQQFSDQALSQLEEEAIQREEQVESSADPKEQDHSGFLQDLFDLQEDPIDLNGITLEELGRLPVLTDLQAYSLIAYRETYGKFVTIYELQAIDGFSRKIIERLLPFIWIGSATRVQKIKPKHIFAYGKHQVLIRFQRVLEQRLGYKLPTDSVVNANPGSYYVGTPERLFIKYGFRYRDRIRFGLLAEKDPGEIMFPRKPGDSLKAAIPDGKYRGFDFYSFHVMYSGPGLLKKLAIGDYQLQYGQGVTLCSAGFTGRIGDVSRIRRMREGIKPHTGAEENRFFRGLAATLKWKRIQFTFFYSANRTDARMISDTLDGKNGYSARPDYSGYHRTTGELLKKNTMQLRIMGTRTSFSHKRMKIGITAFRSTWEFPLDAGDGLDKTFDLQGSLHHYFGMDYHYLLNRMSLFGEVSRTGNGSVGQLHGITTMLHPALTLSFLYRDYNRGYQNPFSNAFAAAANANERGLYCGAGLQLPRGFLIRGYVDVYQFPWLKYRIDRPVRGVETGVELCSDPPKGPSIVFRISHRVSQGNRTGFNGYINPLQRIGRAGYRLTLNYAINAGISMRNRIEWVYRWEGSTTPTAGFLAYHDTRWKDRSDRMAIGMRFAMFDTDSYHERIYAYEQDVYQVFSVLPYAYKGMKGIFLMRFKISDALSTWLRLSRTWYANRNTIGSGGDEIKGKAVTELKCQLLVKLR